MTWLAVNLACHIEFWAVPFKSEVVVHNIRPQGFL